MKTFIWKLKFAWHMKKRADVSLLFGYQSADAWVESFGIEDTDPCEACDEELSNWDNDE
jgi:hypothetical protein